MHSVRVQNGPLTAVAYRRDAKTLLAFDLATPASRTRLAGFTIQVQPPGCAPYYVRNKLVFEHPDQHAQVATEPAESSVNSPLHRFRWVHHPGLYHQGLNAALGTYRYVITPRYFDAHRSLLPLDPTLGASLDITVDRYSQGKLAVGFTRGFVQSQAFVDNFGQARIEPKQHDLVWDTTAQAGQHPDGTTFTYDDMYTWLGFTARQRIYDLLDDVLHHPSYAVDVFAYDLTDSGFAQKLLDLAGQGRARVILDDADLHHDDPVPADPAKRKPEDEFEVRFTAVAPGKIKRGKFSRYSHDKVIVVYDGNGAKRVLTGSTNFSTSGLYVNSNHILVFDDRKVARKYRDVFDAAWNDDVHTTPFKSSDLATTTFDASDTQLPTASITFSPHAEAFARQILTGIATRVDGEHSAPGAPASVLFAVMGLEGAADNPVYETLKAVHQRTDVFSYGITDTTTGIALYEPGKPSGVLVTGKPKDTVLPPPFNQVPSFSYHQVHHKFVVCGVRGSDPVVYCGSSNLALKGEQENGDNLLEIHDADIAMVFAIEALELVDHFEFLDGQSAASGTPAATLVAGATPAAASRWWLGTTDAWVAKYFDPNDLCSIGRVLFAS
jgi:phosphatidylserine/phosphatidylglycerophosphate/cardiolipin synthase-like enzyme